MPANVIYENYQLCEEMRPADICFVVQRYWEGTFERLFHHHVSFSRINQDQYANILRSLVLKFSEAGPEQIIESFYNGRGKKPDILNGLRIVVPPKAPEPGVMRKYCGANVMAWMDWVVDSSKFRQGEATGHVS